MRRRAAGSRPKGSGPAPSVDRVQFRVTPEQRRELEAEAQRHDRASVGEVARRRIFPEPGEALRTKRPVSGFVRGVPPVVFRVTPAQRQQLEREAAKRHMSPPDIARDLCFGRRT